MRAAYLATCAVTALLAGSGLAAAQTTANPGAGAVTTAPDASAAPPPGPSTTEQVPPAAAAAASNSGGVQEVVVTAQRRRESLQKVPGTVQAITGQSLSNLNATTFNDILKYTPNVSFGNNGPGQGSIFMRGLSTGFAGGQSSATIANFPNVAVYLDDQSMQFPSRNVDIYAVDLDRVEVLEGPQGTLFGGGAEAGAIRYITNKPKLNKFEGDAEADYGFTSGGGQNASGHVTLNLPILEDRFAVRAVLYDDRHGGYIDNVQSTFTRSNQDLGNYYFGIKPGAGGRCPNGLPPGSAGCTSPNFPQANNFALAQGDSNPVTYTGGRFEALYKFNDAWDVLLTESLQSMEADGAFYDYPVGSDFQKLGPLQETSFVPNYDHDSFENTSLTVNGKVGPLSAIYTGAYTVRTISNQQDYTNYSRTGGGIYYQCTGGNGGLFGAGTPLTCYSPIGYWRDKVRNKHFSNEARLATPDSWRLRGLVGAYYENFRIDDDMNFNYKSAPACSGTQLFASTSPGGLPCVADVMPSASATLNDPGVRGDQTAFGEDTRRGYDQTAFFANVDFDIIPDKLTISGGTRYFNYREFEVGSQYGTSAACVNVLNGQCTAGEVNINANNDHVTYDGFKSRAVLTWHATPDTTVYYLFSQGFRPGGFNRATSAVALGPGGVNQFERPNGYAPDSLTNNEVGLKTQLFQHRLQVNVSAYYMEWDNTQFFFYNPTELGNTSFGTNGPDYLIKGAEVQFIANPFRGLTIQGSASYNDDFQSTSPCLISNIAASPTFGQCITQIGTKGSSSLTPFANPFGALNTKPAFSPDWEANLRVRYDFDLVNDYRAFVQAGGSYTGAMYNEPSTYPSGAGVTLPTTTLLRYLQPAYATADASIGVSKDRYTVTLFANNLFDSHASTFTNSTQFIESQVPIRPRVVELKVGATF
jgi:iron complex outermembrane recepter protein